MIDINRNLAISNAQSTLKQESDALIRTLEQNSENLADAVSLIVNANKLIISGVGKSGLIARKISATFSSIGVPSLFLHPVEALHGDLGILQPGDVSILISKSGSTEEIVKLFPFIKSKSKIISIVGNLNSYMGRNSDVVLDGSVEKEACIINMAPTTSAVVALALGDALAVATMAELKIDAVGFSRFHPSGQLGRNVTLKVEDVMHTGENLPFVQLESSFKDAIIQITDKGLGCVCILDGQELKGILTDGDIRRALQKFDNISAMKVADLMTKNPITVSSKVLLGDALSMMENRSSQISVLPVVDNNVCIGLIRIHDIIRNGL